MAGYQTYTPSSYTESEELKKLKEQAEYWNNQQLQNFTFKDFDYSDRTKGYQNALANLGDFSFSKQQNWDANLAKLENMKDFSYDLNGDALYQQYKDQYTTQGKMAMMDTVGQAAAMTGGYGNSYAQSVGQQAYQGYLSQLNNVVPELYQLALSKYNSDRENLYQMNDLYQNLYNTEYGTYNTERNYLTENMYNSEASDRETYGLEYQKAYDENNSYNSNITSNRSNFNSLASDLATREWNQYKDQESIAQAAIDMYNTNAAREAQYDYEALKKMYEGYMSPEEVAAYQKAESSEATSLFKSSLPSGREWSRFANGDGTYTYGGKRYSSKADAIGAIVDSWKKDGKLTDSEVAYLKGYYGVDVD